MQEVMEAGSFLICQELNDQQWNNVKIIAFLQVKIPFGNWSGILFVQG